MALRYVTVSAEKIILNHRILCCKKLNIENLDLYSFVKARNSIMRLVVLDNI